MRLSLIYKIGLSTIIAFVFYSCGPSDTELAEQKYAVASDYFQKNKFNDAKLTIDTILVDYSSEIEVVVKAEHLLTKIKVDEQKRNLMFLDSALKEQNVILDKLMKNFILSKDYGEKEVLIHKRQQPKNSYSRTYLRAHLDSKGNFYISSRFAGESYINHNQIKVYNKGKSVLSAKVPLDGFNNRQFEDSGSYWEIVNYKDGKDNGVVDFIAQNVNEALKVQFIGQKHYYIILEKYDKEAISDGYEISFVLKEITSIKSQVENVNTELNRLQ